MSKVIKHLYSYLDENGNYLFWFSTCEWQSELDPNLFSVWLRFWESGQVFVPTLAHLARLGLLGTGSHRSPPEAEPDSDPWQSPEPHQWRSETRFCFYLSIHSNFNQIFSTVTKLAHLTVIIQLLWIYHKICLQFFLTIKRRSKFRDLKILIIGLV